MGGFGVWSGRRCVMLSCKMEMKINVNEAG